MPSHQSLPYRPCAGMMVLNRAGLAFIGRRTDGPEHVDATHIWQMPQGGIDEDEDPYQAALRELQEETSIRSVQKLGEITEWLTYDLPSEVAKQAWGGKYRGQKQKWYALRFTGNEAEIDIANPAAGTSLNSSNGAGWQCTNCRTWWYRSNGIPTNVSSGNLNASRAEARL